MRMMGMGQCYFVVLSPTGYHVQIEPFDPDYCNERLFPALERFCAPHFTFSQSLSCHNVVNCGGHPAPVRPARLS